MKHKIKEILSEDYELIEEIFEDLGLCNVKEYGGYWRMGFDDYSNPSSLRVYKGSLHFKNYKHTDKSGDIFSLVQYKKGCSYQTALEYLSFKCGLNTEDFSIKKCDLPFGGFFKLMKSKNINNMVHILEDIEIESLKKSYFELLMLDGITLEAQDFFNVRYDLSSGRIAIPVYRKEGLVGILGRINQRDFDSNIAKYLPIIAYPKNKVLFGVVENLKYIKNNTLYVVESEKTVLKAFSYGFRNVVALGGNSISETQKLLIHSSYPKNIVVALDEGIELEHIIRQVESLQTMNILFKNTKLGYIDPSNLYRKSCIFDMPYEVCKEEMNKIKWL